MLAALAAQQTGRSVDFEVSGNADSVQPLETPIDMTLKGMAAIRYRRIADALKKLENGNYGICEDCGCVIDEERLEIIPEAAFCVKCQRVNERKAQSLMNSQEETSLDQLM